MTREEAKAYFEECNEGIITTSKDENVYDYEKQEIMDVSMRKTYEANIWAIKALSVPEREKGTLEKIRAEIADLQGKDYYVGFNICKNRVLEIIDKYIGG